METKVKDRGNFAEGSIVKNILRLALPIILAEIVNILYSAVDRMYIGHIPGYGTQSLSGIGIIFPAITIISAFANLLNVGGPTLCSIARGRHDDIKASRIMRTTFTLSLLYGIVLTLVIYVFKRPLFMAFGADTSTIDYALEYANWYFAGTVFTVITLAMNNFINLQGRSTIGMLSIVIGAVINIILDPIFIYTLNLGLRGAAMATVISQFASALWIVCFLYFADIPVKLGKLCFDREQAVKIHSLGVSGFAFKATNGITEIAVNATLKTFAGLQSGIYIASMSLINQLNSMTTLAVTGVTEGAKSVISYNYGAEKYNRTVKAIKTTFLLTFISNFLSWSLLELFPVPILKIFSSDTSLLEVFVPSMRIFFCCRLFMTLQSASQNSFVALNYPKKAVFFAVLRKLILLLPLTLALPRIGLGINGVFWAEAISEVVGSSSAFLTFRFTVFKRLRKQALAEH